MSHTTQKIDEMPYKNNQKKNNSVTSLTDLLFQVQQIQQQSFSPARSLRKENSQVDEGREKTWEQQIISFSTQSVTLPILTIALFNPIQLASPPNTCSPGFVAFLQYHCRGEKIRKKKLDSPKKKKKKKKKEKRKGPQQSHEEKLNEE